MANLSNNRINTTATPAQIAAVKAAFQVIVTNLPFLIGLTKAERKALQTIDVSNKAFTEDVLNSVLNNGNMIPSYLNVANLQNDYTLFEQLDEIKLLAIQLLEKIDDTQLLAGSEAYTSSLAYYKLFVAANDAGVPGADSIVTLLKKRFEGQGGAGTEPTDPTS